MSQVPVVAMQAICQGSVVCQGSQVSRPSWPLVSKDPIYTAMVQSSASSWHHINIHILQVHPLFSLNIGQSHMFIHTTSITQTQTHKHMLTTTTQTCSQTHTYINTHKCKGTTLNLSELTSHIKVHGLPPCDKGAVPPWLVIGSCLIVIVTKLGRPDFWPSTQTAEKELQIRIRSILNTSTSGTRKRDVKTQGRVKDNNVYLGRFLTTVNKNGNQEMEPKFFMTVKINIRLTSKCKDL